MIARAAEYGNDRILMGAHYAMDVLGGRTLALHDLAHLLANDPAYLGQAREGAPAITDYRAAVGAARADLIAALQAGCGNPVAVCAREDIGRFSDPAANDAFYADPDLRPAGRLPADADTMEDVGKLAPEAGYLLHRRVPVADPGAGRPDPDRNRGAGRRLPRRRLFVRSLLPPQPLCAAGRAMALASRHDSAALPAR